MNICILIGTFRPNAAYEVMTENIAVIKSHGIDLQFLADKLFEKKIINARMKSEVTDKLTGRSVAERTNKLLEFLMTSISVDGEDFGIFLEILEEEGTRRCARLAKKLMDAYNEKLIYAGVDRKVSIDKGKNKNNVTLTQLKLGFPVNIMCIISLFILTPPGRLGQV